MAKTGKPVLGVTLGNAAGVGSEIIAKVAAKGFLTDRASPVIIADGRLLRLGMKIAGVDFAYETTDSIEKAVEIAQKGGLVLLDTKSLGAILDNGGEIKLAENSPAYGKEEGDLLVNCIRWCEQGLLEGFSFAPLNKGAMKKGGYDFPSEHEMFAHYYGVTKHYGEMNYLDGLWNIRVTSHIPLAEVCANITPERIADAMTLGRNTLRRAGIEKPRFAMAAVNPHNGDNGTCGREEIDILAPMIRQFQAEGIDIKGPFASDTLFIRAFKGEFDGVVTMYHDQGQIAIKLKGFEHTVTVSAGLPNAITTPAHGTAFDIVGKGVANTSTFEDAFSVCAAMAVSDRANPVR